MQLEAFCRLFALGQPLAMALISFRQTKSDSLQYMGFSALIPLLLLLLPLKKALPFQLTTKCSQGTCLNFVLKHRIHWANLSCSLGRQLRAVLRSLPAITEASLNAFGVSSWYAAYVPSLNLDRKRFALHLTFAVCPSITQSYLQGPYGVRKKETARKKTPRKKAKIFTHNLETFPHVASSGEGS